MIVSAALGKFPIPSAFEKDLLKYLSFFYKYFTNFVKRQRHWCQRKLSTKLSLGWDRWIGLGKWILFHNEVSQLPPLHDSSYFPTLSYKITRVCFAGPQFCICNCSPYLMFWWIARSPFKQKHSLLHNLLPKLQCPSLYLLPILVHWLSDHLPWGWAG